MSKSVSVRVPVEVHTTIVEIAKYAAKNGWASIGATTDEPASITAVLTVAVQCLHDRLKKGPMVP